MFERDPIYCPDCDNGIPIFGFNLCQVVNPDGQGVTHVCAYHYWLRDRRA